MARISNFKDIVAWQRAEELTIETYKQFRHCQDYSFKDQIQRASVSIMNNIAEGFERKDDKEFKRYLYIAKASCAEVDSMLSVAKKLGYITEPDAKSLESKCLEIAKMLSVFIKKLD